jgi:hypothetical protein
VELVGDARAVGVDRLAADAEPAGDVLVAQPFEHQRQHLAFARRQGAQQADPRAARRRPARAPVEAPDVQAAHLARQVQLARGDPPDRRQQLLAGSGLHREPPGSRPEAGDGVPLAPPRGQQQRPRARRQRRELARHHQPVASLQGHIDDRDLRLGRGDQLDGRGSVRRLARQLHVPRVRDQGAQTDQQHRFAGDETDPHGATPQGLG